jgi:hypothetical protein
MSKLPPLTAPPSSIKAKLELVQHKLRDAHVKGQTPHDEVLGFIAHRRRVDSTQANAQPFRRIAIELSALTGVDVTHEAVRRWHRAAEQEVAAGGPTTATQ